MVFEGEVTYSAHVSYDDYETAMYDGGVAYPMHRIEGDAQDSASISGIVKLRVSKNWNAIEGAEGAVLDQSDFTLAEYPDA